MADTQKTPAKARQQSLFDDIPIESAEDTTSLVHVGSSDADDISPLRKKFNAQARKIEELRRKIEERTRACNELLAYWGATLAPVETSVAELQTKLAMALDGKVKDFKLGVRQREMVGDAILGLLDDSFSLAPADEEARGLYDRWNDTSFDEEMARQEGEMAAVLSGAIREHFGIDIDEEILRKGPEALEAFLGEALMDGRAEKGRKHREKTAKQLAKEERERQAEEFAKKSVRSLYLSLAKVLHPDAEPDESAKAGKERLMKEVTAAYEAGDLHTLLRIEGEWIRRESANAKPLTDELLKVYLASLKEQARDLEDELACLGLAPQYAPIQPYLDPYLDSDVAWGKHRIDASVREEKSRVKLLKRLLLDFAGKMEKKDFLEKIREAFVEG
jgi:hypothetical protein